MTAEAMTTTRRRPAYVAAKRVFDIVAASAGLIVLSPLLLVIAVLIALDSRGPVLFRQKRIGLHGGEFTMLKFRTMYVNSDEAHHREMVRRTAMGEKTTLADGRQVYKPPNDPRVTRVGRWLRASCADELPQLINVIRGDMSLVGPRPALSYELPFYKEWHYARFELVPGITGLWQVTRDAGVSFDDMMRLDIEYGGKATVLSDLLLVLRTLPAVVRQRGVF